MKRRATVVTGGLLGCLALWACGGDERNFVDADAGSGGSSGSGGAGATGGSTSSGGSAGATGGASGSGGAGGGSGGSSGMAGSGATGGAGGFSGAGGSAGGSGSGGSGGGCGALTDCNGACVNTNTDVANCGKCGRSCLGTACVAGQCQPQPIHAETGMSRFAVDATHIYYVTTDPNNSQRRAIRRKSLTGGSPQNLALDQTSPVVEVLVDATHVYWAGGSNTATSHVRRVLRTGGAVQDLTLGTQAPQWLGANSSTLFFAASDPFQTPGKTLHRVNKDGGAYLELVAGDQQFYGVAASSSFVFYAEAGTTQALRRRTTSNLGTPASIVTGQQGIRYVVHDANEVFWTVTGAVRKAGTDGSMVVTLGTATGGIEGLAVDATDVYWTEAVGQQRDLITAPRSGGGHLTLLTGIGGLGLGIGSYQVHSDGTWVYYLNAAGDEVLRVAK